MTIPTFYDRVRETSTTTSTGTLTLAGAVTGHQSFSVVGNTNTTYYCIAHQTDGTWEVGSGVYTTSGTTLSRVTVYASSNSGSLVNFASGTKDVFLTAPAFFLNNLLPPGYLYGLNLSSAGGASSAIAVTTGNAMDSTNTYAMSLTTPSTSLSPSSVDVINGIMRKTLSGTVATTSTNATITGTSSAFLTDFGTRNCSGTITGASTTITGTNTKFLSEFAVSDLIGTAAKGYSQITAIASDTSLTITSAIPGGSPAGTTPLCIEQPTLLIAAQAQRPRILTITNNTSMLGNANSSSTASGQTAIAGTAIASQALFLNVWLVTGATGTGVILSTQRTTPWLPTGYTTAYRRIGGIPPWDTVNNGFIAFQQSDHGPTKHYELEINVTGTPSARLLSSGSALAWTDVALNTLIPPTVNRVSLSLELANAVAGTAMYARPRTIATYTQLENGFFTFAGTSGDSTAIVDIACDGAQYVQYVLNAATNNPAFLQVLGYYEDL